MPNNLIKREKGGKQQVNNAHNKPTTQKEGLSLLVVMGWYLEMI